MTMTITLALAVLTAVLLLIFVASIGFNKNWFSKKERKIEERIKEVMSEIYDAAKNTKSAIVVFPDENDIPFYEMMVKKGYIRNNPLGNGYMMTEDYEKMWSKINVDNICHTKFEPDDGVLTRELDPKTGKLVPVITEKMVFENKEKIQDIIKTKREEVEKLRPKIEEEKRRTEEALKSLSKPRRIK